MYCRPVRCPYTRLGCQWTGQYHKLSSHESVCAYPHKTGAELMQPLQVIEEQKHEEVKLYKMILDLMSCEKVVITGMLPPAADFACCVYVLCLNIGVL